MWEEVLITCHGIRLKVKRDKETGLLACPLCGAGDEATYFFTVEDLLLHIVAHVKGHMRHRRRSPVRRVEEEEEEED